jgi:hypothetical protein
LATNQNQLIVESPDDVGAVSGLMSHHVPAWKSGKDNYAVYIDYKNSADEILAKEYLSTKIKESGLRALGIMLDADNNFNGRWSRVKRFCDPIFQDVPDNMPLDGLILENADGLRFGAWIMPDNQSNGMMEDFCSLLVPASCKAHWEHADVSYKEARKKGAPWRDVHATRVHIHTWLAWQDPPGERIGTAITKKMLDPASDRAKPFVAWMKKLYELGN